MPERKMLVVAEGCPFCAEAKERLARKGLDVKLIDASTPEGMAFAKKHGIRYVPQCVIITEDERGETVRKCTDEEAEELLGDESDAANPSG
ncbi:MAG: glutaredoxin domain-containing protein [Candidatus Bathyarchaeia archaeon]